MKSSKMKMTVILLAAAFLFAGCGDALYVMTPEEETAIVSYASQLVAKYNTYQREGEINISQEMLESAEQETEVLPQEEPPKEQQETPIQEEPPGAPEENGAGSDSQVLPEGESFSTINEALDLGVVQVEYKGSSTCTTYEKTDIYAVDAASGKQLLVLNMKLTNPSNQNLHVDILAMTPTFRAVVNGTESVPAQTTILPNDLSTYQSDILAGESGDTVLLFEISEEIQEISSIQLKIQMAGKEHTVNL